MMCVYQPCVVLLWHTKSEFTVIKMVVIMNVHTQYLSIRADDTKKEKSTKIKIKKDGGDL